MKRITSRDVAKYAGVSQSTVSFVLNDRKDIILSDLTKQKVHEAAKILGYSPHKRRGLREKVKLIGIIVPTITNPYYAMLIKEIEEYAGSKGFRTILCNTFRKTENERFYLSLLAEIQTDGIIYSFTPGIPELVTTLSGFTPIVMIGEKHENCKIDTLALNSFMAGSMIARHLRDLGHKKVAFITSPLDGLSLSRQKRLQGLTAVFEEHGLSENLIVRAESYERETDDGAYEIELGYRLTREVLDETDVTAIVGVNDMVAYGALNAVHDKGMKVPEDISVCGFDNTYISKTSNPKMTTIDHFTAERSRLAVDILIDKTKKTESSLYRVEYEPVIMIRDSTCAASVIKRKY